MNDLDNKKNPVIKGLYADPDIAMFHGKYYIYPTTDGFTHWSGHEFKVFSSDDLMNWKEEGVILDLKSDQVQWAVGSAWAPAIGYKNGKYYFYFCGKRVDGVSCIGVAVSDNPIGPFVAVKEPLLTPELIKAEGVKIGQAIDPSVYIEEDGTPYLLFGNGEGVIVRLNEDMVSLYPGTMKNISGLYEFREAVTVLKRDGKYHFTWSCDDTGSENYHLNYGTSGDLYGPVEYHYPILEKRAEKDILGTGHHSIMRIPGKDEYIIAYHRFGTPLENYPDGKGFNREVCIDFISFDENGFMNKVEPSL
jgi:beta-xylosidase